MQAILAFARPLGAHCFAVHEARLADSLGILAPLAALASTCDRVPRTQIGRHSEELNLAHSAPVRQRPQPDTYSVAHT